MDRGGLSNGTDLLLTRLPEASDKLLLLGKTGGLLLFVTLSACLLTLLGSIHLRTHLGVEGHHQLREHFLEIVLSLVAGLRHRLQLAAAGTDECLQ
ncbi:hypothetical protein D3C84_1139860 [compost metagenome]